MEALEQDNDTWQPISLAAGRLLDKFGEEHQSDRKGDRPNDQKDDEQQKDRERYLLQRLKDIERFERGYRKGRR